MRFCTTKFLLRYVFISNSLKAEIFRLYYLSQDATSVRFNLNAEVATELNVFPSPWITEEQSFSINANVGLFRGMIYILWCKGIISLVQKDLH